MWGANPDYRLMIDDNKNQYLSYFLFFLFVEIIIKLLY